MGESKSLLVGFSSVQERELEGEKKSRKEELDSLSVKLAEKSRVGECRFSARVAVSRIVLRIKFKPNRSGDPVNSVLYISQLNN